MTDTLRSKATLDTMFADNTVGAITPQMLRDFVESSAPSFGAIHFTDLGTPTNLLQSTWTKAANTSTLDQAYRFDSPANNQLRYTGTVPELFRVTCALSVTSSTNNQVADFAIYKNGVQVVPSLMRTKITTAGDIKGVTLHVMLTLNQGDYLELWMLNETGANPITVNHGYFTAEGWLG